MWEPTVMELKSRSSPSHLWVGGKKALVLAAARDPLMSHTMQKLCKIHSSSDMMNEHKCFMVIDSEQYFP